MPVKSPDNLSTIVRRHRKISGLSQAELARIAGVGKTAVFDLEHGKESMRLQTVIKILAVLNIKMLFEAPTLHEPHSETTSTAVKSRTPLQ